MLQELSNYYQLPLIGLEYKTCELRLFGREEPKKLLVVLLFKIRARTGVGLTDALEQSKVLSVSKTADFMDLGGWVPVLQLVDAQCLYYV
jgi:hypothetical protein